MTFEKVAIFSRLPSNAVVEMLSVKDSDRIFIENKGDVNVVSNLQVAGRGLQVSVSPIQKVS